MRAAKIFFSLILIILLLASLTAVFAVNNNAAYASSPNPTAYGAGYSAVLYDNTNGLPTSAVNAVAQTAEGFLWIGSYSGLIRYDGNTFYRYDVTNGVTSVVALFVDSANRLWIGSNDSGVFVLQNNVFTRYDDKDGLRSLSVRSIVEDSHGDVIIATTMGVAYVTADNVMHVLDDPQINQEYVTELVSAGETVYGVTDKGAYFAIKDHAVQTFYSGLPSGDAVMTLYPDPLHEGYLYFGTDSSAIFYGLPGQDDYGTPISVAPRRNVRYIRKFLGDEIWIASDDGIGYIKDGVYNSIDALPMNNSVEKILCDFEQNLWFTSSRQGLMKIVKNRFDLLFSLAPRVVNTVCKNGGLYYVGTDTGLLVYDENKTEVHNAITDLLGTVRIRSATVDSTGRIWFGTGTRGLVRYVPSTGVITEFNESTGLAHKHARVMKEMSDGRIAVATKGGVNVIKDDVVTETYNKEAGVNNEEILCLEEGDNGAILAGSDGDGIYVIKNGSVSRYGRKDGLTSEVVMRIKKDPTENLYWIITSNSVAYLADGKITTVNNFPYSNNFDLFFDNAGRVWVLASNGIYVVKKNALIANNEIEYDFFDSSDGLPAAATANSYSYLDTDGTLYIAASTVGSTSLYKDFDSNADLRLAVPYVLIDDVYYPINDGEIRVPARAKRLVVNAYAFTYSLNNPHLTYQLEGFDEHPVKVLRRDMAPVTYTNLPGGKYTFKLSALNTMTGEVEKTVSVVIIKEKTVYEQIWFWIIIAILGVGLVVTITILFFRRKTKKLLEKQAKDTKLINEMTSVFARCIDMKDAYTNGHSHRVAQYTAMLAERMGLSKDEVEQFYRIALLHDIGKIGIPDSILNKPGRLTDEEFAVMKSHSQRGYDILKEVTIAPDLAIGAGFHHERQDGRGYPHGITKEEIPLVAQIIAVADTFDAMHSTRPYRKSMSMEDITAELKRCSGTQLNSEIVDILLKLIDEGAFDEKQNDTPARNE